MPGLQLDKIKHLQEKSHVLIYHHVTKAVPYLNLHSDDRTSSERLLRYGPLSEELLQIQQPLQPYKRMVSGEVDTILHRPLSPRQLAQREARDEAHLACHDLKSPENKQIGV